MSKIIPVERQIDEPTNSPDDFRAIVEGLLHGVIIHRDYKALYASEKCAEIFGYANAQNILAMDSVLEGLILPEDRHQVEAINAQRARGLDVPARLELRARHGSGKPFWIAAESHVINWQGEKAVHLSIADISQRKRTETELLASEHRFRNVFRHQFHFMAILDPDGRIQAINDLPLKIQGAERSDYIGKRFWRIPAWRGLPERQQKIRAQVETAKSRHQTLMTEDQFIAADGSLHTAKAAYTAIRDHDGRVELILVQAADVTEFKQIEQNLRESNEQMRLVLQSASMGTWEWDVIDNRVAWSPETCEIFATDESRFGGNLEGYLRFTDPRDLNTLKSRIANFLENASPGSDVLQYEHRIIREDGTRGWVEVYGVLFFTDSGKPLRMVGICIDTSKRKNEEQLIEQKNIELERFNYTVSHELKTPLVTINGFLSLLDRDLDNSDIDAAKKNIRVIAAAIETMGQQLEDLLELSRIGRIVHPPESFSMAGLCELVVREAAGIIDQAGARIEIERDMPDAFADPVRVKEVVQNLIENAVKFAGQSASPEVRVSAEAGDEYHIYRVRDNGPGIEPRYHERVFELFDRLDSTTPGTGIGLTIVKRIVEVHGGNVWVESDGKSTGTAICFTLPRSRAEQYPGNSAQARS